MSGLGFVVLLVLWGTLVGVLPVIWCRSIARERGRRVWLWTIISFWWGLIACFVILSLKSKVPPQPFVAVGECKTCEVQFASWDEALDHAEEFHGRDLTPEEARAFVSRLA